ncbi:MAG TPA: hypothetical protein VN748_20565 [Pseudonocardiaceae bacterium]|nr:hypothetical protein [Pseudonocardiaceae bacterium]
MTDRQIEHTGWGMPRKVRVKGTQGVDAMVSVTVVRGMVWMSIRPPFTWEAIMEPKTVEAVIRALELARGDAVSIGAATTIREITRGPVAR